MLPSVSPGKAAVRAEFPTLWAKLGEEEGTQWGLGLDSPWRLPRFRVCQDAVGPGALGTTRTQPRQRVVFRVTPFLALPPEAPQRPPGDPCVPRGGHVFPDLSLGCCPSWPGFHLPGVSFSSLPVSL